MKRMSRWISTAAVLAAVAAVAAAGPAPAYATGNLVACTLPSSESTTFDPPMTATPTPTMVTVDRTYSSCVSLSQPAVVSGTYAGSFLRPTQSCVTLLGGGSRIFTITWNTGQTSTLTGTSNSNIVGAAIVNVTTGTVTSGLFSGASFTQTVTTPSLAITFCTLGLGTVASATGLVELLIV
ncbi:hypothetical protein F4553_001285 [Allocatelliglobosispora scoriae]|uniref:Uncharacterized protein n=1 Tax=Allocatelliglobosispora scoriae TaxID=643052 RepID=A0A841BKY8_9ACTN|nr:hypothetical protein [Allocatelliglobosispora scoriae]MBB5867906.1 hypothetical protein [Allocatelliglobosispora scoriae]